MITGAIDTLQRVIGRLQGMREDMYDISDNTVADETLFKIVKLEDVDDKLYEVIVLLYSRFKAESQLIKSDNHRRDAKMTDCILEVSIASRAIAEAVKIDAANKNKKSSLLNRFLVYTGGAIVTVVSITILFGLFRQDHEAGRLIIEFIKSLTPFMSTQG